MLYQPSAIAQTDLDTAEAPYLGGEFAVYLSRVPAYDCGTVTLNAPGSGANPADVTWTPDQSVALPAAGCNLQMVATSELDSPNGPCTIVFNVKNDQSVATTLTFTFTPPARANDQTFNFSRGIAVDGVLAAGSLVTQITGLQSVTNGNRNETFDIYQLPNAADYVLVGCTTSKKFTTKSRKPVGIDCGMESDAFVKRGKSGKGELTIDSKFGGMADRLTRFDGAKTTAMLLGIKDGVITTDRIVFAQFIPGVEIDLPDGDGEAMENAATGKYVEALFFVAP
jgi:hypothetical protein